MRPLFEPLKEYERIARNQPFPGLDKAYPRVTDGTTSSVIEKTPRRILQQTPTGVAKSPALDWLTPFAGFILTDRIIPNANSQFPFLQKCQIAISKALTYGSQPAYIPFVNRGKYFGSDMILPYIKDVFLEPGKLSDTDSNYILMRSWYQPRDIKAIIAKEEAQQGKDTYDSGWDLQALREVSDSISQKDDLSTTPNERDKNNRNGGVEIIHAFQRGIGAKFYSFHPQTKKVVRTRTNPDPRGEMPIHFLYASSDASNPLGRGFVEMVGAMQNLMDAEVQMYQFNRALMLNPPTIKRGNWAKSQAKLVPNVLVDLGSDPAATWEPMKLDSTALANFPQNYSLMQSQIYQLLSAPSSNISAQAGNTQFSKTSKGVDQQNSNLNVDDTFIRNQVEAWLEKVFETQLNLYFAERHGVEEIQLDPDTADDIRNIDETLVNKKNMIRVDWDKEANEIQFRIDPGSSEEKDDAEEITQLKEILADVNQNPYSIQYVQQAGKDLNLGEVYKQLFQKLGLRDIEKILTDVPTGPDGQKQVTPPMAMDKPKLTIAYDDVKSPNVRAALLNNAGIHADPNDIAQYDQLAQQAANPPKESAPQDHPIIKLMSSLNIKFTDLPEDSKQEVLQIIGIPSQMTSPTGQGLQMQAIDKAHQILQGTESQVNTQNQMTQDAQQGATDGQNGQPDQTDQPQPGDAQPDQQTQQPSPEDQAYLQELQKYGLTPEQAQQALVMLHSGYSVEQVIQLLGANHG